MMIFFGDSHIFLKFFMYIYIYTHYLDTYCAAKIYHHIIKRIENLVIQLANLKTKIPLKIN